MSCPFSDWEDTDFTLACSKSDQAFMSDSYSSYFQAGHSSPHTVSKFSNNHCLYRDIMPLIPIMLHRPFKTAHVSQSRLGPLPIVSVLSIVTSQIQRCPERKLSIVAFSHLPLISHTQMDK